MKKLTTEQINHLVECLYQENKDKIDESWTPSQFKNWCKKKIRNENASVDKIDEKAPFVYWNAQVINTTKDDLIEETPKKKSGRPKKEKANG